MKKKNEKDERIVSHVASLVLGIVSIISLLFWYISLPTGITAIVLGVKSYKKYGKKMGIAGLVTGIVGVSLCLLIYLSLLIIIILQNSNYYF